MKVIIDQDEIKLAIAQYVLGRISKNETQKIHIELAAGRGPSGFRATITITDTVVEAAPAVPTASLAPLVPIVSSRPSFVEAADPVEEASVVSADLPSETHNAGESRTEVTPTMAVSTGTGTGTGKANKRSLFKGLVHPGAAK